ncbi:MAG: UDP-N-acetylglucosamine--N-acetylmuramyl-(pentapeptide) pyrophosphoryl-undecaprenol N-acetylglucosamine transferase [Spirochaetia bacterium]|nr:UDP-N-acetylglucosamine--N-acetylmuramyl-(pentapeptide) pyrophosphoryl-undecaprenol N-acetylglucosamine transferase [Spirochaetia bacterium]
MKKINVVKICYTGGGTGGHIFPIFAVDKALSLLLKGENYTFTRQFIGRIDSKEQFWVEKEGIPYYAIHSGKLRRYFSIQNFFDVFKVISAFFQALYFLQREKPLILFSKGGFVSVPVVIAAYFLRIPIIAHDSDATPGLANRIAIHVASTMCVSDQEVISHFPKRFQHKCVVTGVPSRLNREEYIQRHRYPRPLILFLGGSLGAQQINNLVTEIKDELLQIGSIIHQTGYNKGEYHSSSGYEVFSFIEDEYIDILYNVDIVVSRGGATALADFIEMEVPSVLIPLGKNASRGDQVLNAAKGEKLGISIVLQSETVTSKELLYTVENLLNDKEALLLMKGNLRKLKNKRGQTIIASIILDTVLKKNDNIKKI